MQFTITYKIWIEWRGNVHQMTLPTKAQKKNLSLLKPSWRLMPSPPYAYFCEWRVLKSAQRTSVFGQTVGYTFGWLTRWRSSVNEYVIASIAGAQWGGEYALIDGGATRNLQAIPPIEKPISWVDITSIQLSTVARSQYKGRQQGHDWALWYHIEGMKI